ncbi:MAG: hypothetical protein ACXW3C_15535, partial [Pyrinomonadaceae bacterium]
MPESVSMNRRRFAQLLGAGAAYIAAAPQLSLASQLAIRSSVSSTSATLVRLSSNENPYGPSPMAIRAMTDAFQLAWRYPDEHADVLTEILAQVDGVNQDQILLGNGSGEILKLGAAAFT